ncbi:multidrug efflux SMR transporter [Halobacillus sp. GSS1]|uniref:DMT family transporter n=1 Tax=Halobacillus sp. GSS1 TaxID=2815919 RepID=UPI001A8D7394|nr:multidrug efflux SMR transporter [Halobacillus sp. GSS1]MBN9655699.1 multidrug efflux SMR transporter [Halobacillus sp. GSS1]
MAWIYLFFGAFFEIGWAVGLKLSKGFTDPLISTITVICIVISFTFFTKALKVIDIGTGYAIFTGIGAAGTALIGMIFLGDGGGAGKVFFIMLLITGIIGLKMSETNNTEQIQEEG